MKETFVVGPPGTGKTTYLADQVRRQAQHHGAKAVAVMSFTRAAAQEAASRGLGIPRDNVGTLHGHCWRALERPTITETLVSAYNEQQSQDFKLTKQGDVDLDGALPWDRATKGDELLQEAQRLRGLLTPREYWPPAVAAWMEGWERFQNETESVDFTGLIEDCLQFVDEMPCAPRVLFVDEAQDHSPLELALVRKWAKVVDHAVIVGDADQCIYEFKGANPKALNEIKEGVERKRIVLKKSWRVPRAVHAFARRWICQIKDREDAPYMPRSADGKLRTSAHGFRDGKPLVREAVELAADNQTVMFLASCSYMLGSLKDELRAMGVPFHNPYRSKRGDWNPLGAKRGTTAATRIVSLLCHHTAYFGAQARAWTWRDVKSWIEPLRSAIFVDKNAVLETCAFEIEEKERTKKGPLVQEVLKWFKNDSDFGRVADGDLDWYYDNALKRYQNGLRYPIRIASLHGPRELIKEPRVIIGTIHSVKGGEADHVYLLPDVSFRAAQGVRVNPESRDAVVRLFYVGITRARESLTVCASSGEHYVGLRRFVEG